MSSFLLCWDRAGAPIDPSWIAHADRHSGAGEPRRLLAGSVAAWHWPSAWAPGAEEALPMQRDGWVLAGTLRLDARSRLADRLRDLGEDPASVADDRLALASFRAWGDRAAAAWIGDYAVAALAPEHERLIVTRGVTGVRACFVLTRERRIAVSDDLGLLVRLDGGREAPADATVAEYLTHGQLVTPRLTFHRRIERVPSAHTLVIERSGTTRLARHWQLPAPQIDHRANEAEVVEGFRSVLGHAVADRLRGPRASILLSGGLDSPALAVEARRAAPTVALHALTASWERLVDDPEPAFARAVATAVGVPQTVHVFAPDEGLPDATAFRTPEPVPDAEPLLWRAQAARLAAYAPVALLGEDPDAILTPPTLAEQLRADGVRRTASAWMAHYRATGSRPWAGVRQTLRGMLHAPAITSAPDWLRPECVEQGPAGASAGPSHPTRREAARKLSAPIWDATCWLDDPVMTGANVITLMPFMDPRVIAYCFALPPVPWLQRKWLLRRAYRDLLPAPVLQRPKRPVTGYYRARVERWRAQRRVPDLAPSIGAWVDLPRWHAALEDTDDPDRVWAAWRVLELSRWLSQDSG